MSQILNKFISANAVDDLKFRARNNQPVRARNAANSGDISVFKVDGSNIVQLLSQTQIATSPSAANDVANKAYVDALVQGLKWKDPVRAIATSDITLSGAQTIDGVSVIAGDRVLVAGQSTGADNGIYVAASGSWSRSVDADASSEILQLAVFVEEGTTNADTAWVCSTDAPITLGTTALSFVQFSSQAVTAGAGLTKTGSTIDVIAGDASILVNADELHVQEDAAGAIVTGGSGIKINLETSNPSLQISSNELGAKLDGAGAITSGASGLIVGVDGATIKISANALKSLTPKKENLTLNGTDITNQYKDLAFLSVTDSVLLSVDGVVQIEGTDYSLSAVGGVTRLTFAGDLATGGNAALVSGDILNLMYQYL